MNKLLKGGAVVLAGWLLALTGFLVHYAKQPVYTNTVKEVVGAASGPDFSGPYLSVGGVARYSTKRGLTTATTTVCAIKSPGATSTLVSASVQYTISTTTAATTSLARAATPYATTTLLDANVGTVANTQATIVASTTAANSTFAPNQYFVVGMAGGSCAAGTCTFSPVGSCEATFEVK